MTANRKLGQSMKPRVSMGQFQHIQPLSTAENTPGPENTPRMEADEGIEPVVPLEGVKESDGPEGQDDAENAQRNDVVALEVGAANTTETASEDGTQLLEEMLTASRDPLSFRDITKVTLQHFALGKEPQAVLISAIPSPTLAEYAWDTAHGEDGVGIQRFTALGEQQDGTYKLVVAIPEGYIEGVKSQAELDNMTTEDWVSQKLAEYFEQWWFAPKQSK